MSGNPLANWVIDNQYPPALPQPHPTDDAFGGTLPGDIVPPPTPPPNLLRNPSFEEGHYDLSGSIQVPNEWTFSYAEGDSNPHDTWPLVAPEVRVLPASELPPEERDLFVLDGNYTLKAFKGNGAWNGRFEQTLIGLSEGQYQLTIPVFADLVKGYNGDGSKIWADDPNGLDGLVRILLDDQSVSEWVSLTPGQLNELDFVFPAAGDITLGIEFMCPFPLANSGFFADDWNLVQVANGDNTMIVKNERTVKRDAIISFLKETRGVKLEVVEREWDSEEKRQVVLRSQALEIGDDTTNLYFRVTGTETDEIEVECPENPNPPPVEPIVLPQGAKGIDISAWQDDFWATHNPDDYDFFIFRCSDWLYTSADYDNFDDEGVDTWFWHNVDVGHASGKPWAAYHYLRKEDIPAQIEKVLGIYQQLIDRGTPPRKAVFEDGTPFAEIWPDVERLDITSEMVQQFCEGLEAI